MRIKTFNRNKAIKEIRTRQQRLKQIILKLSVITDRIIINQYIAEIHGYAEAIKIIEENIKIKDLSVEPII